MESFELVFVASESLKSVAKLTGIPMSGNTFAPCPLVVGDVISYPSARGLFFRVAGRWFRVGDETKPGRWYVTLEQALDPLAEESLRTPSPPPV